MTQLDILVTAIEEEFSVARAAASRAALHYLQRSYEEGWNVGERDLRAVLGNRVRSFRPDPNAVRHVSHYTFQAIRDVERFGADRVRRVFQQATDDATLDVRDVTRLLRHELYDVVEEYRLPIIARTETNRAGNAAKVDRYKASGVTHHEALTAEDLRVRTFATSGADHAAINGQVRRIGEPFRVPRVRGGPNDNGDAYPPFDPGCRCTVLPVLPGLPEAAAFAEPQANRLRDWKRTMGGYASAMLADMKRPWREAFRRADVRIERRLRPALFEARNS